MPKDLQNYKVQLHSFISNCLKWSTLKNLIVHTIPVTLRTG